MDSDTPTLADVLKLALRGGFKSSEFWLAVLALVSPWAVTHLQALATTAHPTLVTLGYATAAAVISAVYSWAAAKRKSAALQHAAAVSDAATYAAIAKARADSEASARAGEALGVPPLATGGNVGTPAPRN